MEYKYQYFKVDGILYINTKNNIIFAMDQEFEYLLDMYTFRNDYDKHTKGYYIRYGKNKRLHRLLTNCPDHLQVDHINGKTRDNTMKNLRCVKQTVNQRNRIEIQINNTSGIKGVRFDRFHNRWRARWYDESGKEKTKSFSSKKYPNAKQLAINYRKEQETILGITHT